MVCFKWREIGGAGCVRPAAQRHFGPGAFRLHTHDFPEVFWIASGSGKHEINGTEHLLSPGTLVFIRAPDIHAFRSDANGVMIHNVAVHPRTVSSLQKRFFLNDDAFWGGTGTVPTHHQVGNPVLSELLRGFQELQPGAVSSFAAERFLLNLLHHVHMESGRHPGQAQMPGWLAQALVRWRAHPDTPMAGTPLLARLAGRSPEHVSRTLYSATRKTPTDLLNELRMGQAARQLSVTDRKIADIAMECGFESLGHFYAMFRRAHGCTPRAYRLRFLPRAI